MIILVAHYCSSPRCLVLVARSFNLNRIYSALLSSYPPTPIRSQIYVQFPAFSPVSKSGTPHLHLVPLSLPRIPFWCPRIVHIMASCWGPVSQSQHPGPVLLFLIPIGHPVLHSSLILVPNQIQKYPLNSGSSFIAASLQTND